MVHQTLAYQHTDTVTVMLRMLWKG